jgi:hypothetical protein
MMASLRSSTASRFAGAAGALWLCGAGAAWAGDGGSDLGTLQAVTSGLCSTLGMTSICPTLPTITQNILEIAGLENSPPEMIGAQNGIAPGNNVYAGNPAAVPTNIPVNSNTGLATLPLATTTPSTSEVLAMLTPLAFISSSKQQGTAAVTPLYNNIVEANVFLYAVGVSSFGVQNSGGGNLTNADTLYLFYDNHLSYNQTFTKGQIVAKFSYPLTVLNKSVPFEKPPVLITLEVTAICSGGPSCLYAQIINGFGAAPSTPSSWFAASQLGIQFAFVFSASPTLALPHAIFEVAIPLLVTGSCAFNSGNCYTGQPPANTDPPYFYFFDMAGKPGPINTGIYSAFGENGDDLGATPTQLGILPTGGYSIGLAPTAGPFTPSSGTTYNFGLCADLPDNFILPVGQIWPSVGAYYAIGTDGETFLSAALPAVSTSVCPAL